jgi:subtilisin family serine protease
MSNTEIMNKKRKKKLIVIIIISGFLVGFLLIRTFIQPVQKDTWNLTAVNAPDARTLTKGNKEIVVAVIDSGIDFTRYSLWGTQWKNLNEIPNNGKDDDGNGYIDDMNGWDFVDNDNKPSPGHWHANYVSYFIVAIAQNVSLMNIRVINNDNRLLKPSETLTKAIDYAVQNGADIIQLSIYTNEISDDLRNSVINAYQKNVIIVGITGNKWDKSSIISNDEMFEIGKLPEIIAVSAVDETLKRADFSLIGPSNEICAPGTSLPTIHFTEASGTSFASPHVTGCIVLMKSVNPSLTNDQIRTILRSTATDLGELGHDVHYGYGLLNLSEAVKSAHDLTIE